MVHWLLAEKIAWHERSEHGHLNRPSHLSPRIRYVLSGRLESFRLADFILIPGLMVLLDEKTVEALRSIFPLIAGLGLGMLFHTPYQIFTRTLKPKEIASGTSAFFLVRFTGATVGLVSSSYFCFWLQSLKLHNSLWPGPFSTLGYIIYYQEL